MNVSTLEIINLLFIFLFSSATLSKSQNDFANHLDSNFEKRSNSFILVGDTQKTSIWEFWREKNPGVRKIVLEKIASENPAFVIQLGDLVYYGASSRLWSEFNKDASDIYKKNIPILPVPGNHEYYGFNKWALENYFLIFPKLNKKTWYSFHFHSLGIILLNSNFDDLSQNDILHQQNWYAKQLENFENDSSINYILVACHHPPYTNSMVVNDNPEVQNQFVKPFNLMDKTRLFFSGHCHSYEHFIKDHKHFIVSGGGGGPRHKLETDSSKQKHWDVFKAESPRNFHYCKIIVFSHGLKLQMIQLNESLDTCSLGEEFIFYKKNISLENSKGGNYDKEN